MWSQFDSSAGITTGVLADITIDYAGSELVRGRDILRNRGNPRAILRFEVVDGDTARLAFIFNRQERWATCRIRGIDAPDPKRERDGTAKQLAMKKLAVLAARDLHYHLSGPTALSFDINNGNGGWTPRSGRPVVNVVAKSESGAYDRSIAASMVRDGHVIEWYGQLDHSPWRYLSTTFVLHRLGSQFAGMATADLYLLPPR